MCRLRLKAYPLPPDDLNEPCMTVIIKKRTDTPSFCTLLISSVLLLGWNNSTLKKINSCQRVFKKRILGAFKILASTFHFIVKKRFSCTIGNLNIVLTPVISDYLELSSAKELMKPIIDFLFVLWLVAILPSLRHSSCSYGQLSNTWRQFAAIIKTCPNARAHSERLFLIGYMGAAAPVSNGDTLQRARSISSIIYNLYNPA